MAYLRDGTLDILGLQYYLTNGFEFPEAVFHPEAYIISVEEPDSGGRERAEKEPVYALIQVYSNTGFRSYQLEDKAEYVNHLNGDVWVGTRVARDGTKQFGCFREGSNTWSVLEEGIWDGKIESKK